jgi:Zn-dependent protease
VSIQILKVGGISIRLHFTLLIALFFITWLLATFFIPSDFPNFTNVEYWLISIIGAIVLFVSLLIHEIAHLIVAMRFGVNIRQTVLFIFGGVSDMEEEEKEQARERKMIKLKITLIGPVVNFIMTGLFGISWWLDSQNSLAGVFTIKQATEVILYYASIWNALLGLANLIPASPLDGGRILYVILIKWSGKKIDQATKISLKCGTLILYGLIGSGLLSLFTGSTIDGFWLILIAWSLQDGTQTYLSQYDSSSSRVFNRNIQD